MAELPRCKNKTCPRFGSNVGILLIKESPTEFVFGCSTCKGIEVRTKEDGWKRAEQENGYRAKGRPEYARTSRIFGFGKSRT